MQPSQGKYASRNRRAGSPYDCCHNEIAVPGLRNLNSFVGHEPLWNRFGRTELSDVYDASGAQSPPSVLIGTLEAKISASQVG